MPYGFMTENITEGNSGFTVCFPSIIQNVEKYFKLQPPALRRYGRETPVAPRLLLSQQLRETLKTSIYRLTDTFSSHLG